MIVAVNLAAAQAGIAAIHQLARRAATLRLRTVQRLHQRARDGFQLAEVRALKQVGVPKAPAFQTALEQLDGLLLCRKIGESHEIQRLGCAPLCCGGIFTSNGMLPSCRPSTAMSI